jgi:type VI secretion system protein ImpJ
MKIYRPLWEDGAALAPQQFQQQVRWNEHVADMVARMGISHPWGVVAAEFDDAALALSRLNAIRLVVRFRTALLLIRIWRIRFLRSVTCLLQPAVNLLRWLSHCRC